MTKRFVTDWSVSVKAQINFQLHNILILKIVATYFAYVQKKYLLYFALSYVIAYFITSHASDCHQLVFISQVYETVSCDFLRRNVFVY